MARRRRRSGARPGLAFLLIGVVIAALLFGADRLTLKTAEDRIGQQLQGELGTPTPPAVTIEGFPFLTQVLRQSLSSVHLIADAVKPTDQQGITLAHVDLRLHQVTSADALKNFKAARVDGDAVMDYPTAQKLIGLPVSYASDGRVEITVQTQVLTVPVTATVVGRPMVNQDTQTLTLGDPKLTVAGVDLPNATSQQLLDTLLRPVPISGVPFGLSVSGITALPGGLDAALTGANVPFRE
jgi:hypothetical protein